MSQDTWSAVDTYFNGHLVEEDEALTAARESSVAAGLPAHEVAPNQGKLLHLLARLGGARRVLEIGTLGGYSTIWLARALPEDGHLVTLEADPVCAATAATSIARARLGHVVDVREGRAADTLPQLAQEMRERGTEPFDLVFIDADKPSNPEYLEWALRLTRPGSLIVGDNVVRDGAVVSPDTGDARVDGVRRFAELVGADPRLEATALQTVGSKGYDGFLVALVTG
ncbi:O-methyltransferase [Streptomyces sp. NPDC001777]|uniref:O-methyltransferase n=1 Tax=Streptomyces sp. NPDC001777 TaxID=3364608 RepID=UPI0036BAAF82